MKAKLFLGGYKGIDDNYFEVYILGKNFKDAYDKSKRSELSILKDSKLINFAEWESDFKIETKIKFGRVDTYNLGNNSETPLNNLVITDLGTNPIITKDTKFISYISSAYFIS